MTSNQEINNILKDLQKHKHNKNQILEKLISDRLEKCTRTYYQELAKSSAILSEKDPVKLIRKVGKM